MNKGTKGILITVALILLSVALKVAVRLLRDRNDHAGWTPEITQTMYNSTIKGFGGVFTDSDERKIAGCIIGKLKSKYPNGIDVADTSGVEKQTESFGEDCMKGMVLHFTWSQKIMDRIKKSAKEDPWVKALREQDQGSYCTCYINRLKQIRPNGIVDHLKEEDIDSASAYCKKQMVKN